MSKKFNIHPESTRVADNIRSGSFEREYFSWDLVKEHEKQCQINHNQNVETLHKRGGLGWSELWFVLHDEKWKDPPDGKTWSEKDARDKCRKYEAAWLRLRCSESEICGNCPTGKEREGDANE